LKKNSNRRSKRYENKEHLKYVAQHKCFITRAGYYSCDGPIQVHHLLKPSDGKRGWSLKAGDDQTIPLCMFHHSQLHTKFGNEFKFLKHYGFKEDAAQKYAKILFERSQIDNDLPF
jgi:hypothetical protein